MNNFESYKIDLENISEGVQTYEYILDDAYFQSLEGSEIGGGNVQTTVKIERKSQNFVIDIALSGVVTIECDICLDPMQQPIEAQAVLIAKCGEAYEDDGEVITIDEKEGILDLSWLIYEQVALAIPLRHVHEEGKCNPEMIAKLASHEQQLVDDESETTSVDERWNDLEKLKTIFKD